MFFFFDMNYTLILDQTFINLLMNALANKSEFVVCLNMVNKTKIILLDMV